MRTFLCLVASLAICATGHAKQHPNALRTGFVNPPASARPWVYWFWLNGNITREGITADMEAMKRAGIGGVLIMEVDQGTPAGPIPFAGSKWRALFRFVVQEAARLGLEVNMNDDAGWNGSGGPWITPERAMQKLVWSETEITGPMSFDRVLPQPPTVNGYYRDVSVLAFPAVGPYRIPEITGKSALVRQDIGPTTMFPTAPEGSAIDRARVVDLTGRVDVNGRLIWQAPPGTWTIVRFGHTLTGAVNSPAPDSGRGLECDKLSKEGSQAAFDGLMGKLIADAGPLAGKTLVRTHIDSWENGSQNWTSLFRDEFRKRRGYDLLTYLPVATGRVVTSSEVSERYLWDWRQTISDLVGENYAGHMATLARKHGLGLSIEAYGDTTVDNMTYAGRADEPMAEFWAWSEYAGAGSLIEMTSAAHIYGRPIIGAEAFTSHDGEKWLGHPGNIKGLGDWAFSQGINRFVVHRYALQPWKDRRPGMSMGPWGLHYERGQTWWEMSTAWHRYVSRCQYMLRRGQFVADVLYLQSEGAPRSFAPPPPVPGAASARPGYNYDGCTPEVVMKTLAVRKGRLVVPSGMSYRLLVLPDGGVMTPALLRRVRDLVRAGALVLGSRPKQSPSLVGYPGCDDEVRRLASELWDTGKVLAGRTAAQVLGGIGVPPDFECDRTVNWIHRRTGQTDIYFVANPRKQAVNAYCRFRVAGKRAAFWHADSGRTEPAVVYTDDGRITTIPIRLDPSASVFVVFEPATGFPSVLSRFGRKGTTPGPSATRANEIVVHTATWGAVARSVDVTTTVQRIVDEGQRAFRVEGFGVADPAPQVAKQLRVQYLLGGNEETVSAGDFQTLRIGTPDNDGKPVRILRAIWGPPGEQDRTKDVTAQVQRYARERNGAFLVADLAAEGDPAVNVVKTLRVEYSMGPKRISAMASDPEVIAFNLPADADHGGRAVASAHGAPAVEALRPGVYEGVTRSGVRLRAQVARVPVPTSIRGPWKVRFDPKWGGPGTVTLAETRSWSQNPDPRIRYYSGTAVYRTSFEVPAASVGTGLRAYLDLGDVHVMARVTLNGQDMGIVWKSPYRLDVTGIVRRGANTLRIAVVNLWPNRQIGDEMLAEDSDRNPDGTLRSWPQWLTNDQPSPTGRFTFSSWRLWPKSAPLQPSGLIGPVRLISARIVPLSPVAKR